MTAIGRILLLSTLAPEYLFNALRFLWTDQSVFNFDNWAATEPNDDQPGQVQYIVHISCISVF